MTPQPAPDMGLVFDVGAHMGEDTDFYLRLGYRVVAVEANPALVAHLRERFAEEITEGRCVIVPNAIGDAGESITFYTNTKVSAWGTTDPSWALRNAKLGGESSETTVPCIRFESLLDQYGVPVYLKIDIEGADMLCVNALDQVAVRPKYVSIESTKTSWRELLNECDTLERLGYTKFKVVDQCAHRGGEFQTRSGESIRYSFPGGATGPFGEDLRGPWLSKRQALVRYMGIFCVYKTIGDNTFLPRVLRHIPIFRRLLSLVSWYDTHAMRA